MRRRPFGDTGTLVSEVGFGGWGIGGVPWGRRNDARSLAALDEALERGFTLFDTAPVYGDGHSEILIGRAVARRRARGRVLLATKMAPRDHRLAARTSLHQAYPAAWIRRTTESSLRRLRTDCVDLQQFHTWRRSWRLQEEQINEITRLKDEGKIRWIGISVPDREPDAALPDVRAGLVDAVQAVYNLFDQSAEHSLLRDCKRHGVAVIARSPINAGALSGTFSPGIKFAKSDWRGRFFTGDFLEMVSRRAAELEQLAEEDSCTLPELALRFSLSHPAISTVIPGMRRPEHVRANARASKLPLLSESLRRRLRRHAW
jgi:aryl-alcohol dehydrogenase-like predicted oxidoreductase